MKTAHRLVRLIPVLAVLLLLGCAANPAIKESRGLLAQGRIDDSVLRLEQALRDAPDDRELRAYYFRQRDLATAQLLAAAGGEAGAGRFEAAQALYDRVRRLDPHHPRVRDGLAAMAAQQRHEASVREASVREASVREAQALARKGRGAAAELPAPTPKPAQDKPITLEFRDTPLKTVFEVIARTSGLNFVFDKDVRVDTKVTIFVRNTGVHEVVKLILATNQLQQKLLNDNTALIYPNTPAKAKDYLQLVTRSFYLANADVKQAQAMIRALVKTKDIFADDKLNLLVIKDTPDAVRMAERLLESLDMAEPEVMLDVEVLEISSSKLHELGLRFPDQIGYGLLGPVTGSAGGGAATNLGSTLGAGLIDLRHTGGMTAFIPNPAVTLNLKSQAGDGNLLANPRIRVKNREKAKIHIGDRLPVFTTTSTANVGVAASVSYLDVGLKLDVEPNVYLDDEVSIKVGLEVSSIVREIPGPGGSMAYQIGARSASTVLRLKNGETQVLAGLISDEERSSADRLPGVGDIPVLGRLFSSQRDNSSKTEIVLLITPRIVRNIVRPEDATATIPAGSESFVGAPALQIRQTGARGLSLSSNPAGGARAVAPVPEPEPEPAPPPPPAEPAQAAPPPAAPAQAPATPAPIPSAPAFPAAPVLTFPAAPASGPAPAEAPRP